MLNIANPMLPVEVIFNLFIDGKPLRKELSEKIMRQVMMADTFDYDDSVVRIKKLLNQSVIVIGRQVITIKTPDEEDPANELTDCKRLLLVRYVNICHHGRLPIVINDETVYLPKTMEAFEKTSVLNYIKQNLPS